MRIYSLYFLGCFLKSPFSYAVMITHSHSDLFCLTTFEDPSTAHKVAKSQTQLSD